jgi:hypothetical protein
LDYLFSYIRHPLFLHLTLSFAQIQGSHPLFLALYGCLSLRPTFHPHPHFFFTFFLLPSSSLDFSPRLKPCNYVRLFVDFLSIYSNVFQQYKCLNKNMQVKRLQPLIILYALGERSYRIVGTMIFIYPKHVADKCSLL